ncbi:ribonuclease M5 [Liquorilactobacillus vini]|uniref:Ribonuclease M5 n=1 Tax=Liquorilactobacillus vini DSM 20605 TaxID=1133569 RepID=A0A0R2C412_9LACO|nr:ribonuclease M5 [Liquorilactobacillus vini]KRM84596.1 ribonuclease M5 [Liquorilactobacillus vini DSM 20605]
MKNIKEVIVVEGKDDTKRIKLAVKADTLETNGSAISPSCLQQIALLQKRRGVIVFTDPDFSGEKIRQTIAQQVPGVKHAFLTKQQAIPGKKGSLGVEHASVTAIRQALANVYTERPAAQPLITRSMLQQAHLTAGYAAKSRRARLGEILQIGYTNGKRLYERLNLFQITPEKFQTAVAQLDQEEKKHG